MGLERDNILTLIGSRRYHSCILTTFSFDFFFFEMKTMKWLRSCGVRNVNVFIDGHYYSELMEQMTGEEMKITPGYSLYPIFQKSIFHPKLWILFGAKEGLLIVGSGNLTNSGNGSNDEIWGAFHFDIRSTDNAPILSAAWSYISLISSNVKGQMKDKTTRWILDYSKWIYELPATAPFQFINTSRHEQVAFLYNSETSSIWEELSKHIGNETIVEITAISPFYDKVGQALMQLKSMFPSASINVVLDESGLLPSAIPYTDGFKFYNWYDAGVSRKQFSGAETGKSKLHAKIIHFKAVGGQEYCLFGSANVTPEGLGLAGRSYSNTEVSLLVKSDKDGMLSELGLNLTSDNLKALSDFIITPSSPIQQTIIRNNQFKIQLLSVERIYNDITILSTGKTSEPFTVAFFDKLNRQLHKELIQEYLEELKVKVPKEFTSIHYVQLIDDSNKAISNKLLVTDYLLVAKTHPDPKTEEIEGIFNDIQGGELSKVVDLLHYALVDDREQEENASILNNSRATEIRPEKNIPNTINDLSSYKPIDRFNTEKNLLTLSTSLRVLDMLKYVRAKSLSANNEQDIRNDEQEENLGNISGNDENEVKLKRSLTLALLTFERRKLISYFDNRHNHHKKILQSVPLMGSYKPSISDLSRYLIGLELIFEYGGKTEKYDNQGHQCFFNYLPFTNKYTNDNVKGCCFNLVGLFLMLSKSGFKDYEFDYTKRKMAELKEDALVSTIICLVNNRWNEKELNYFYTMLLNSLHCFGWKAIEPFDFNINRIKEKINNSVSELKHRSSGLDENLERFFNRALPVFREVIQKITNKEFNVEAIKGQFLYKSPFGFCYVDSVNKPNEFILVRPGFIWDNDKEEYIRHSTDEIYTPIKLSSFISIDL
ncbi:MAG: hypothetical protein NT040_05490 [Bacteroidetes bacterium]|nr:hypothetical protein [Bacteroidota bacterium]